MMRRIPKPTRSDISDSVLAASARDGDATAFTVLADRYARIIYGIGWSVTGRAEDADDMVQDTLLSAHSRLHTLKEPERIGAWIGRIARNTAFDVLARRKRHRIDDAWLTERDLLHSPAEEAGARRRENDLWLAVSGLKAEDRAAVVLHYMVGLDQRTVADTLGIPLGTVKSRLNRSRRILKGKMSDMADHENVHGPEDDFGRTDLGGMKGSIDWEPMLRGDDLEGWREPDNPIDNPLTQAKPETHRVAWSRNGDAVMGRLEEGKTARLMQGDETWWSYELSVLGTLVEGSNLQVHFRISDDGQAYYLLDFLTGWEAVAISRRDRGAGEVEKLDVVNFPIEKGREYNIMVAARGQSLTSYIDGKLVNRVTDDTCRSGGAGFNMWWGTTVNFHDPRVRHFH